MDAKLSNQKVVCWFIWKWLIFRHDVCSNIIRKHYLSRIGNTLIGKRFVYLSTTVTTGSAVYLLRRNEDDDILKEPEMLKKVYAK
jgi:hypothetical protein